jgi:hypothetical protein
LVAIAATTPPPPLRLSMTMLTLVASVTFFEIARVTTSDVPPGGNGTRMVIGRVGKASLCAEATCVYVTNATNARPIAIGRLMVPSLRR